MKLPVYMSNSVAKQPNDNSACELAAGKTLGVTAHWQLLFSVIKLLSLLKVACCYSETSTGN